jgi:hypothetical protein
MNQNKPEVESIGQSQATLKSELLLSEEQAKSQNDPSHLSGSQLSQDPSSSLIASDQKDAVLHSDVKAKSPAKENSNGEALLVTGKENNSQVNAPVVEQQPEVILSPIEKEKAALEEEKAKKEEEVKAAEEQVEDFKQKTKLSEEIAKALKKQIQNSIEEEKLRIKEEEELIKSLELQNKNAATELAKVAALSGQESDNLELSKLSAQLAQKLKETVS